MLSRNNLLKSRSGGEIGKARMEDEDDNVELEKSNVLLMGPTGSGMTHETVYYYYYFLIFFGYSRLLIILI